MDRIGERASEQLLREKVSLAETVTRALYAEIPELEERYGERGRHKCLQDMTYTVEHLAPAVALADPSMFEGYVCWLRDLLEARHVPADELRRSLELMREALDPHMPADEAHAAAQILSAGIGVLRNGPSDAPTCSPAAAPPGR